MLTGNGGAGAGAIENPSTLRRRLRPSLFLQTSEYGIKDLSDFKNVTRLIDLAEQILRDVCKSFSWQSILPALSHEAYFLKRKIPVFIQKHLKREITETGFTLVEPTGSFDNVPEPIFLLSLALQKGELTQLQVLDELLISSKTKIENDKAEMLATLRENLEEIASILRSAKELKASETEDTPVATKTDLIEKAKKILVTFKLEFEDELDRFTAKKTAHSAGDKHNAKIDHIIKQLESLSFENISINFDKKLENLEKIRIKLAEFEKNRAKAKALLQELERIIEGAKELNLNTALKVEEEKLALENGLARAQNMMSTLELEENVELIGLNTIETAKSEADKHIANAIAPLEDIIRRANELKEKLNRVIEQNTPGFKETLAELGLSHVDQLTLLAKPLVEFFTPMQEGLFGLYMNIADHRLLLSETSTDTNEKKGLRRSFYTEDLTGAIRDILKKSIEQLEKTSDIPTPESLEILIQGGLLRAKLFFEIDICFGSMSSMASDMADYKRSYYSGVKARAAAAYDNIFAAQYKLLQTLLSIIHLFELIQNQIKAFNKILEEQKQVLGALTESNALSAAPVSSTSTQIDKRLQEILRITEHISIIPNFDTRNRFRDYRNIVTYTLINTEPKKKITPQLQDMDDFLFEIPHHRSENYVNTLSKVFLNIYITLDNNLENDDGSALIALLAQVISDMNEVAAEESEAYVAFERNPLEYLKKWLNPLLGYLHTEEVNTKYAKFIFGHLRKMHIIDSSGNLSVDVAGLMTQLKILSAMLDSMPADIARISNDNFVATPVRHPAAIAVESPPLGALFPSVSLAPGMDTPFTPAISSGELAIAATSPPVKSTEVRARESQAFNIFGILSPFLPSVSPAPGMDTPFTPAISSGELAIAATSPPAKSTEVRARESQAFNIFGILSPFLSPSSLAPGMVTPLTPAVPAGELAVAATSPPISSKKATLARLREAPVDMSFDLSTAGASLAVSSLNLFSGIQEDRRFDFHNAYLTLLNDFLEALSDRCRAEATEEQKTKLSYRVLLQSIDDNQMYTLTSMLEQYNTLRKNKDAYSHLKDCYDAWFSRVTGESVYESQLLEIFKNLPTNKLKMWFIDCLHALKMYFYATVDLAEDPCELTFSFRPTPELADATQRDFTTARDAQLIDKIESAIREALHKVMPIAAFAERTNMGLSLSTPSTPSRSPQAPDNSAIVIITPRAPSGNKGRVFFREHVGETPGPDIRAASAASSGSSPR